MHREDDQSVVLISRRPDLPLQADNIIAEHDLLGQRSTAGVDPE